MTTAVRETSAESFTLMTRHYPDLGSGASSARMFLRRHFAWKPVEMSQNENSPYNINALENIVVMRIEYTISEDNSISLIDNQQILPTTSIEKV